MSDWEIAGNESSLQEQQPGSEWEMSYANVPKESLGKSLGYAIPRIGYDLFKNTTDFLQKIPDYAQQAATEIPAAASTLRQYPMHGMRQLGGGLLEGAYNLFNTPHDIANYATNRLNLIPEDINQKIQMGRMPADTPSLINQRVGSPQYPGEEFLRGVGRHSLAIPSIGRIAAAANPLNLTHRSIARNIVAEGDRQVAVHNRFYNQLWRDANRSGFNNVPVNQNLLTNNLNFIRQYKSPRDYRTLENFNQHPTLPNAQAAVSDVRNMRRSLEEKSRTQSLTGEERHLYDALENTENHIEGNMFRDRPGNINEPLSTRYRAINNSYRENVVPYRYNKDIQAFRNRELLAKQLTERLKVGEFAARKGWSHPSMKIREMIAPMLKTMGVLGGGKYLYDQALGNQPPQQ